MEMRIWQKYYPTMAVKYSVKKCLNHILASQIKNRKIL